MKILQVTHYFLPHRGGLERFVYYLSKNLADNGQNITVFTSNIPESKPVENLDGIIVFRFTTIAEPLRNPIVPRFFFPIKNMREYDLIHVHTLYSSMVLLCILQKKLFGIPVIVTHHGRVGFEHPLLDFFLHLYENLFFKKLLSMCDQCIALSESDARFLTTFTPREKITIIPNGINPADLILHSEWEIDRFLLKYNLNNKKIVLFIGRLIPLKGAKYLIEAFSNIREELNDLSVQLVIAGDGIEREALLRMTSDKKLTDSVLFIQDLSDADRNYLYQSAAIFVLTSLSEGFPTTVLEAMYYGVPVIGTDIPVMNENFSDSVSLVPPRDDRALADAILGLLVDPDLAQKLSSKGKEAVKNFTWDRIVKNYIDVYSGLVLKKVP